MTVDVLSHLTLIIIISHILNFYTLILYEQFHFKLTTFAVHPKLLGRKWSDVVYTQKAKTRELLLVLGLVHT